MINYFYDCYTILNKVYSDKTYLKQAISSTFIEEKNRALTVKTCYGVLDKDIELLEDTLDSALDRLEIAFGIDD